MPHRKGWKMAAARRAAHLIGRERHVSPQPSRPVVQASASPFVQASTILVSVQASSPVS